MKHIQKFNEEIDWSKKPFSYMKKFRNLEEEEDELEETEGLEEEDDDDDEIATDTFRINTSRIFRTKQQIRDYVVKLAKSENVGVELNWDGDMVTITAEGTDKELKKFEDRLEFGIKHLASM